MGGKATLSSALPEQQLRHRYCPPSHCADGPLDEDGSALQVHVELIGSVLRSAGGESVFAVPLSTDRIVIIPNFHPNSYSHIAPQVGARAPTYIPTSTGTSKSNFYERMFQTDDWKHAPRWRRVGSATGG